MNSKIYKVVISIFVLYFLILNLGLAQNVIEGKVIDKNSKTSIPYATIFIRENITNTTQDGWFSIEIERIDSEDSLQVKCLGYEDYEISLSDYVFNDKKELTLNQKSFTIEGVNVNARKNKKNKIKKFGIFKRQSTGLGLINNMEQIALYIPNKKGYKGIIQNVQFYIRKAGIPNNQFRIHLYTVDSISNGPHKELLSKSVFASGTVGDEWVFLDISRFNLSFPSSGFFIAIEAIQDSDAGKVIIKGTRKFRKSNENVVLGLSWEQSKENRTWILTEPFENWRIDSVPYKNVVNTNAMMASEILIFK